VIWKHGTQYLEQVAEIPNILNKNATLEQQARQASEAPIQV